MITIDTLTVRNFSFSSWPLDDSATIGSDLYNYVGDPMRAYTIDSVPADYFPVNFPKVNGEFHGIVCPLFTKAPTKTAMGLWWTTNSAGIDVMQFFISCPDFVKLGTGTIAVGTGAPPWPQRQRLVYSVGPTSSGKIALSFGIWWEGGTRWSTYLILLTPEEWATFLSYYYVVPDTPTSPEFPGNSSSGGGGNGNFDDSTDSVDDPTVPQYSFASTNMATFWAPSLPNIQSVADYLSTELIDIFDFSKWGVTPFENILSLTVLPVDVPKGLTKEWKLPNALVGTGIEMPLLAEQFMKVDCGTVDIREYWGSALDYSPYTRISIYLPFIGIQTLAVDEIMGAVVNPVYTINLCTGEAVCNIKVTRNSVGNVLYTFPCTVGSSLPITASDASNLRSALIRTAVTGAAAVAIPAAAAAGIGAAAAAAPGKRSKETIMSSQMNTVQSVESGARDVISSKAEVMRSGNLNGGSGFMAPLTPYLIITRPIQSLPENYNQFRGYPSNMTMQLSNAKGFTKVSSVHVDNIGAYPEEIEAIESYLLNGVYL